MIRSLLLWISSLPVIWSFDPKLYGEWSLWHSNTKYGLNANKIIISLYPKNNFEYKEKKQINIFLIEYIYQGNYKLDYKHNIIKNEDSGNVIFCQEKLKIRLLSIFGIGFDELPIFFMQNVRKKVRLHFDIIGKDDIFLNKYENYFHLIRHTRVNEPSINVPLSTFLFTNLLSLIFNYTLHKYFHLFNE